MLRRAEISLPLPSAKRQQWGTLFNVTLVSADWFVICKCFVW
jgi:hypothetical protein